jgi:putative ABC transport system permease protein
MVRDAIRRGLLPIINQMSAAGIVTLPGIMTGQILAADVPAVWRQWVVDIGGLLSRGAALDGSASALAFRPAEVSSEPAYAMERNMPPSTRNAAPVVADACSEHR